MNKNGLALVTVLIFTLVMTILAGAMLSLMTTEARLTEHQIRRIEAYYAAQAGVVHVLDKLRNGAYLPDNKTYVDSDVKIDIGGSVAKTVSVTIKPMDTVNLPKNTRTIESKVDYAP